MRSVVKQTEDDLKAWLATEAGFVEGLCRWEGEPLRLEGYQRGFLANHSRYRWVTKSRQVGFSFLFALEALARCHLRQNYTAIFVSYNQADATEKIVTARQLYEELPAAYQKKLIIDSRTELAFESNRAKGGLCRIISVPSKPPRGKRGDLYLDELAHYVDASSVYSGSTALILRTNGQLTGCSTPLGRRGIFWEIAAEELRRYPHHTRQIVPWWLCSFFCTDVPRAALEAPDMPTLERVAAFGTEGIKQQLETLPLDDFQQEFEATFVDSTYSFFEYDLILPCTGADLTTFNDATDFPQPEGRIVAGFDVGRTRDYSELAVFEERGPRFICRMLKRFEQVPFADQEADLRRLLETLPVARLSIDRSGIGMNLAENLARDYPQVIGENFTNEAKERWCTDFKILLQHRDVLLPRRRELIGQIHGIKRRVLPSGKVAFEADRTVRGEGHADRFWAIALACQKERQLRSAQGMTIGVRIIG
jgi:phage FluMu gp28-like protein